MADILPFVPKHERTSQENLAEFIRACREDLKVFGEKLVWSDNYWKAAGVSFGNIDKITSKLNPVNVMKPPFLDFAKAYFRYQQGHKSTGAKLEMRALKCVERALVDSQKGLDVACIDSEVLDRAAVLARIHYSPGVACHAGREIARLSAFLSEKNLIPTCLDWQSPIVRPTDTVRTGIKAREERERKLPSIEVLDAIADIFAARPNEARDIFTTCVVALLLCAPSRITEVLALLEDCEVWEKKKDGTRAFGLRFQPGKGAKPMIKWIPDIMVDLAQEAIRRVREMTTEARRVADWLEKHPTLFYRHSACPAVVENELLSVGQSASALGLSYSSRSYAQRELWRLGVPSRDRLNTLATLNIWIRQQLPTDFPWYDKDRDIRFSEALFCLRSRELRTDESTSTFMVWKPTRNVLNGDLCSRETSDGYIAPGIFDRHNLNAHREIPLKATSHQFRHHLNTIAQRGGLSQSEIARWSGRIDVKQNRSYDHMTEFELSAMIRRNDPSLSLDRPLAEIAEQIANHLPMTRQEFNSLAHPTAHVTEWGFCIRNWATSTCQKFRDCLNCSEQICVKGDKRIDRIRTQYAQVKQLKEQAELAMEEGDAGADRWYELQCLTEKRLAELLSILEDPSLEEGSIVRLRNENEFSPFRRALEAKDAAKRKNQEQLPILNKLRRLKG